MKQLCWPDFPKVRKLTRRSCIPTARSSAATSCINAMLEDGKITAQQAADAKARPLQLNVQHDPNSLAPYFVEGDSPLPGKQIR